MSHVAKLSGANNTPTDEKTLAGKTVLVTGSSRGIGLAVAKEMLKRGANVMFHGTPQPDAANMTEEQAARFATFRDEFEALQAEYPMQKLAFRRCDIGNYEQVKTLMEETAKLGDGKIDVLVNNAGIQIQKSIETLSPEEFDKVIKTNMYGPFYATKAALPYMTRKHGEGFSQIINMSSVHGLVPSPERGAYCMAKHGEEALKGVSAAEFAKDNIRVNNVNPAFVRTDLAMKPIKDRAARLEADGMTAEDAMANSEHWRLGNQGGGWIEMDEVVQATANLADFTDTRKTGESVEQGTCKDAPAGFKGYVEIARDEGAAFFEKADKIALDRLNAAVAQMGAKRGVA